MLRFAALKNRLKIIAHEGMLVRRSRLALLALLFTISSLLFASGHDAPSEPISAPLRSSRVASVAKARTMSILGRVPLWFEPNEGQFPQATQFAARTQGFSLYLLRSALVLKPLQHAEQAPRSASRTVSRDSSEAALVFIGSNRNPAVIGLGKLQSVSNYFHGSDPRRWLARIAHYSSVEYRDVYPRIDLICRSQETQPEFVWIVRPGADPAQIRLSVQGASPSIDRLGNLVLKLPDGEARLKKPAIYQEISGTRYLVSGQFTLLGNDQIAFKIGHFDRTRPLIVDPALVYSTYLGGSSDDETAQVSVDGSGNIYVIGTAQSNDFPLVNPLQSNKTGFLEAFVTKFDASGSNVVYSTYLGGTAPGHVDRGSAIAVDEAGNAYITGQTNDLNFPTTPGAYLPAPGGVGMCGNCTDGWAAKLDPTGSSLLYSTYLTGNGNGILSTPSGIAFDAAGDVYLTGAASPTGFPVTPGAYSTTSLPGGLHAFITKLNSDGSALVYSSIFGGNANDQPFAIAIDPSDNAYITGTTSSTEFPVTTVLQAQSETQQAFVVELNVSGNELMYSTLFGAGEGFGITVDASGNAYVTGYVDTYLFPTAGPMQTEFQDDDEGFVSKLNPSGTNLVYSIFLGGEGYGIAVDSSGNAYVTGTTQSADFPTVNAIQPIYSGGTLCGYNCSDAFVTVVSADGSKFPFSTYLGDIGFEAGYGIAIDSLNSIYVTGITTSLGFPLVNPYQAVQKGDVENGGANSFVAKIIQGVSITPQRLVFGPAPLGMFQREGLGIPSAPQTLTFANNASSSITFASDTFAGINPTEFRAASDNCAGSVVQPSGSCAIAVVFTPAASGIREANLQLNNSADDDSPFIVSLIGYGSPVTFSPAALAFALQSPGTTSAPQALSVTNRGTAALTIDSLTLGGYNPQFFPIQTDGCTGTTLTTNNSCSITFTFSPPNIGQFSTYLAVNDTASDSPQSVLISGTGIGPQVTFSNYSLEFANQAVGTTSTPQLVTLNNAGTAPLVITGIATTLSDFGQSNNCNSQIAAGGSCTIQVSFTPAAAGVRSGGLQVSDNASGSPQQVNLSGNGGTGNDFAISVSPPSSTVTDGNSASFNISVSPVDGAFNSAVSLGCSSLPQGTSCVFSATSVTPGTSSAHEQLTISTTATGISLHDERFLIPMLRFALCVTVLSAWLFIIYYYRRPRQVIVKYVLFASLCFLSSCGGGNSASAPPPNGTPAGTYSITVTGTSGSLAHSQSVSLTVQ